MTWTCKNRPFPCGPLCEYENSDANVGCLNCGATKPAELGEEERATLLRLRRWANGIREAKLLNDGHVEPAELGEDERAAWELMDKHRRAVGWDRVSISEASPSALKFAVGFCKDARAPLEAEKRRLEAELAIRRAEASSLRRRLELAQAEKPGAPPSGKPEYWQALRWGADLVASRGDSQVSAELAAPFYKLAREIEGAICKEWGTNGPTGEPAAPAGLPEVGTEVEVWEEPSYNLTVKAVKDEVVGYDMDRRRLFRTKQHGVFSVELEGTSWRRLPPAQTSAFDGSVATAQHCIGVAPAQTSREPDISVMGEQVRKAEEDRHPPLVKPAASPPGEVSTENLQKEMRNQNCDGPDEQLGQCDLELVEAAEADIRAAVERESAKWERLVDEWGKRFQAKEDRIAELTEKLQRQTDARIGWEKDCGEVCKQRDAAQAEVSELRGKFEHMCGVAGLLREEIAAGNAEVERLKGELARAKTAKRCPADGMSDEALGSALSASLGGYGVVWERHKRAGAKARELFAPSDPSATKGDG